MRACEATLRPCQRGCGADCAIYGFAEPASPHIPLDVADFLRRLLDPEDLGHAVSDEVRQIVRGLLA